MHYSWRAEHGEPPTEAAVWDLYRLEQKSVAASTQRLERAEAESSGNAPMPPSMVSLKRTNLRHVLVTVHFLQYHRLESSTFCTVQACSLCSDPQRSESDVGA